MNTTFAQIDNSQIWTVKKDEQAANKKKPKTSAAQVRVQKGESARNLTLMDNQLIPFSFVLDLTELDLPPTMKTDFPDPANLLFFKIILNPDEGEQCGYVRSSYS